MAIKGTVFCRTEEPRRLYGNRGTFAFEACPRVGEHVVLRYLGGDDSFIVREVAHEPPMPNDAELARQLQKRVGEEVEHSSLWLYVEWVESEA